MTTELVMGVLFSVVYGTIILSLVYARLINWLISHRKKRDESYVKNFYELPRTKKQMQFSFRYLYRGYPFYGPGGSESLTALISNTDLFDMFTNSVIFDRQCEEHKEKWSRS